MTKKRLVDRIFELFSRFKAEVELHNKNSQFDINIYSETLLIPLLNFVYGLNLKDANYEAINASAVDLVDYDNRVAIQVTSTPSSKKIKDTLETFIKDKRYENFDTIQVYILSTKQKSYTDDVFTKLIDGRFDFNSSENVFDGSDVMREVKSWISIPKITEFLDFLEEQFSDDVIEGRRFHLENMPVTETQTLFPNILEIEPSKYLYVAKIDLDREQVIKQSWETKYRLKNNASMRKVIQNFIYSNGHNPGTDWCDFENTIISFRDLGNPSEPLSKAVDIGTVERISTQEYFDSGEKYHDAFRNLLSFCFIELLIPNKITWLPKEKIYRFDAPKILNNREERWKGKKYATRTIVKQLWNEKKDSIIAFQHLAFTIGIFSIYKKWHVSITPTYSITLNGHTKHRFAKTFIAKQKLLDKNQTVHNHFRFISFCMTTGLGENPVKYPYLSVKQPTGLSLTFINS